MTIQSALLLSEWRVAQRRFVRVSLVSCHYGKSRFVERVDGILYKSPEFLSCSRPTNKRHFSFVQPQAESSEFQRRSTHEVAEPSWTFVFLSASLCRTNKFTRPLALLDRVTCADCRLTASICLIEAINRLTSWRRSLLGRLYLPDWWMNSTSILESKG